MTEADINLSQNIKELIENLTTNARQNQSLDLFEIKSLKPINLNTNSLT